ncbi:ABC transporter D family member 1 [Micractinium conductrix]|uniref:ABC transporter D family member 1 n=1 Tax=Micractinium conductrix TaxID=554055 RepID=A0A2P6V6M9_9CHLO|nr:ABC transporter D family member 1 [Micractinium conductrix]|eukprot:PSC69745.1 ABC transporter D family member 1 [Micractinium conductrix]
MLLRVAGRKVLVVALLAILRTALSNRLARLQGYLFRAAFLRRVPLFARNLAENLVLCGAAAALEATSCSWVQLMELQWRRLLTGRLHSAYFADMTYYKLNYVDRRIDSPEARMCEDAPKLASGLADLTRELVVAAVDALFYAYQLKRYSGTHKYTAAILGYVFGVGSFMAVASPNFGGLFKRQAALEGSHRALQARLRGNAESVAFYRGIAREGELLRSSLRDALLHQAKVLGKQWRFGMVQDFLLKYLGATVAVYLIIGPFFRGHMRPENTVQGRAQMLSNMRYHTSVIISLFGALGTLGGASRKLMKLGAHAERLREMERAMKEIKAGAATGALATATGELLACEDAIVFEDAVVVTPGNATLVRDLSLRVPCGTNLLVTGPNGAGKSSLFRVLGGLWPLTAGRIHKPGGGGDDPEGGLSHDIFYVPQRPYVTQGSLQEQLIYPLPATPDRAIPDQQLRELLRTVDLEYLLDREGGAEGVVNWGEVLSLGEQQRLGMARLFFHRPRFAILDECTSGVTVDMEERFCQLVKDLGCTCITISHRPALMAFHDIVLSLDGEGGWSLHPGHRTLQAKAEGPAGGGEGSLRSPPPPLPSPPAPDGGNGKKGRKKKQRATDADAVLRGMTTAGAVAGQSQEEREEELGDGNEGFSELVVARAPTPSAVGLHLHAWAPRLGLKPAKLSPLARWKSVLAVLAGGDRQWAGRVAAVAGVVMLRTLLQDRIASLNGRSVDLVLRQDLPGFVRLIGVSVAQSVASAVLAPSLRHVADMLALNWRARLTKSAFAKYLAGNTFYTASQLAGMQDIDQRLTRDIERLCDDLAALIPTMVKPVVDIAWFSWQLWRLTGRRGMVVLYLYTVLGWGSLRAVTPDFGGLLKREMALEGQFRNAHVRLRTHAESVAFFGGGAREGSQIGAAFGQLTAHLRTLVSHRWAYGAADDFFAKQLPHNVTWLLTLLYAMDHKGDFGDTAVQGALVHQLRYLASVVTQNFSAFGELLALPKRFAEISGGITRVSEALEVIDKAAALSGATAAERGRRSAGSEGGDSIQFRSVDVVTPTGKMLARQLSLEVSRGGSLLVTGPNGSGKTSLFRLLAGLWPLPDSDGALACPAAEGGDLAAMAGVEGLGQRPAVYYVPQKPYTTPGSLRDQVLYPLTMQQAMAPRYKAGSGRDDLDNELAELLGVVRLRYLLEREGGWDVRKEWGEVLSLGEQQRLGMARLFFHRPMYGVLDECTNATSVDIEEALYQHAASLGITLITITQRTALVKYHQRELRLVDGEGDWQLREIHESRQAAATSGGGPTPRIEELPA